MDKIVVSGIRLYAFHGCMPEEGRIGAEYEVNLTVWADLAKSAKTDELADTVDYVHLNKIAEEEMAVRTKLLETVVEKIMSRIFSELVMVQKATVSVSKLAPPIEGDVERVSVEFTRSRA